MRARRPASSILPHEVSVLMADIVAHHLRSQDEIRIYDPTSGSGSLLITIGDAVKRRMGDEDGIAYYARSSTSQRTTSRA